jgi:phosphoglycerol transferase MdoB-like AlkP superfamily enzyme
MTEAQKSGKPQFFMALTTTNHPPFEYPDNMQLPPLTAEWYNSIFIKGKKSVKTKYGLGAQYSNRCLGDFMTALKQSELAENTIVIAIGDHNVRSILNYDNVPAEYKHRVPMYIYLPPQYALTAEEKERISKRFGCHFDILPTIARYAFIDGVEYLNIGQNLFDMGKEEKDFYSYNVDEIQTLDMEKENEFARIMQARITLMKLYYQRIFRNSIN